MKNIILLAIILTTLFLPVHEAQHIADNHDQGHCCVCFSPTTFSNINHQIDSLEKDDIFIGKSLQIFKLVAFAKNKLIFKGISLRGPPVV
jgi:hypothetical protein